MAQHPTTSDFPAPIDRQGSAHSKADRGRQPDSSRQISMFFITGPGMALLKLENIWATRSLTLLAAKRGKKLHVSVLSQLEHLLKGMHAIP